MSVGETDDQPTRSGALGPPCDAVGRTPAAVVFDARSGTADVAADEWLTPADRPVSKDVLGAVGNLDGTELRAAPRGLDGRVFRISSI